MCQCKVCERNHEYVKYTDSIPDKETREYFMNLLDYILEIEEDNEFYKFYSSKLREKYPEIYNEIRKD